MAKIIIINNATQEETLVATFRADVEAFQCASLFQAMLHPDTNMEYRVVVKRKGLTRYVTPDSFRTTLNNSVNLLNHLNFI